MSKQYVDAILRFLASREYQPLRPKQLARQMGIAEEDYGTFREAVKVLRDSGQVVLGASNALTLPDMASKVVGVYRQHPRGFGFVIPDSPNAHGDLFIPPGNNGGAITGDHVGAVVRRKGKRAGKLVAEGEIVEIVKRGRDQFVGILEKTPEAWFVLPEGKGMTTPIVITDIGTAGPKPGTKVVAQILQFPEAGELPTGVIVEVLGEAGPLAVETLAIIRAHGLSETFPDDVLDNARSVIDAFDPKDMTGREDLTREVIVTIDPPDARDFDDAISLVDNGDGTVTLGVHIADVSHFVKEGSSLDSEAHKRGTSVYFPRKVLPMLPEVLSNGVCSLQEGKNRYCKSVFITYDSSAQIVGRRAAESVIASFKRLTYIQAQAICDGETEGYSQEVIDIVRRMDKLARKLQKRRFAAGMLHLDLPDVELVFDADHRVVDAVPEDQSFSHTIIEMFMVEANEAVATLLDVEGRGFLRRIHPEPDPPSTKQLTTFLKACGHKLPSVIDRHGLQALLNSVRGKPESYAVNLAILKMFQQAEYSPMRIGHFALASNNYSHFTSPIRRYPDLTVHRLFAEYCRGRLASLPPEDMEALAKLGEHCTVTERHAEGAEDELRTVLLLQHLETKIGETFEGVITGVTNFGMFVQAPRYLIDGLVRMEELGDDWWELDVKTGRLVGERTGTVYRIGNMVSVIISSVDIARRELRLVPEDVLTSKKGKGKGGKPKVAKAKVAKAETIKQPFKGKKKGRKR